MLKYVPRPCVIVDIETTGGNVTYDRITEIGIIEVTEEGVKEWSTLINPRIKIPDAIQRITGITNSMVATAPYFEQVAKEIILRLQGKLFIAHNVRFDYGFIRNEFARLAYAFKARLMCTVKFSRSLYAECNGHSLEKIIARHQIYVTHRHRALDDARATYKFITIAEEEQGEEKVRAAIKGQYRKESLPAGFNPELLDGLPNTPGVYYFWGENKELLYVGKSVSIRKRVMSHFTSDHKSAKEMKICQQTRNITYEKTAGELSALILESRRVKEQQPLYNRRLRRVSTFYSIYLEEGADCVLKPKIFSISEMPCERKKLYGLFSSNKKAVEAIQSLSDEFKLCYQVSGLERPASRACSSHQLKKCSGYCVGKQPAVIHNIKMLEAFSGLALKTWPYKSPVALIEKSQHDDTEQHLVIDNWCILGIGNSALDYKEILNSRPNPQIDKDIYRYLVKAIFTKGFPVYPITNITHQ
ncbi:MAG: exonuclease domain-containing protein [Cellvibrio sp.]